MQSALMEGIIYTLVNQRTGCECVSKSRLSSTLPCRRSQPLRDNILEQIFGTIYYFGSHAEWTSIITRDCATMNNCFVNPQPYQTFAVFLYNNTSGQCSPSIMNHMSADDDLSETQPWMLNVTRDTNNHHNSKHVFHEQKNMIPPSTISLPIPHPFVSISSTPASFNIWHSSPSDTTPCTRRRQERHNEGSTLRLNQRFHSVLMSFYGASLLPLCREKETSVSVAFKVSLDFCDME